MSYSIYNVNPQPIFIISPAIPVLNNEGYKASVLKYKNNSSMLTKNQKYANLIRGSFYRKTWATQNQVYTNPNTNDLPRSGNSLICTIGIIRARDPFLIYPYFT